MQPHLESERLILTPVATGDLDALWRLWRQPDVRRFLWDDRVITREEAAAAIADALALADKGLGLWKLEPLTDAGASLLGCAGLLPVTTATEFETRLAGLVEPLVALDPRVWRAGLAAEALATLVGYASRELRLTRLAGVTDVPNAASDRMLRRAGFQPLGECAGPRYPMRTYLLDLATPG